MFPQIAFREWYREREQQVEFDLLSTSLNRPGGRSGGLVPAHIRDLPQPDDVSSHQLLVDEYGVSPENVIVTARCQHANFLVAAVVAELARESETGSETDTSSDLKALVETPTYEPLARTPEGFGLTVERFQRRRETGYALEPSAVEAQMTEDTALLVVTNRHNPSGCHTDFETLEALSDLALAYDAFLLVDEVFSPFVTEPPDAPRTAFGGATAALLPNTIVTNSLTKFFGLYDVNIGWVVADEQVLSRIRRIEDHTNVVARPNLAMATRALANASTLSAQSHDMLRKKHDLLSSFLADRDDLDGFVADDMMFALFRHESADGNTVEEKAIEHGVWVFPGSFFGEPDSFRVSLGYDMTQCRNGLSGLGDALDELEKDDRGGQ